MIRIYKLVGINGVIYDYPNWVVKNKVMEIKFHLLPDPKYGETFLCQEMELINVLVYKRNMKQDEVDKWAKGVSISETALLCDFERDREGYIDNYRFFLIL